MNTNTVRRILGYLPAYKGNLAAAIFGALVSVPLGLFGPVLIGQAIDEILGPGQVAFAPIARILFWLAVTAIGAGITQWVTQMACRSLSAHVAQKMRHTAFARMNEASLAPLDGASRGDLVSRLVNDADAVSEGLLQALSQLFPGIVTIVATIVLMFALNTAIALVVILVTPLSILFARFVGRRTGRFFRAQSDAQGATSAYTSEAVRGLDLIRAFGFEAGAEAEFSQVNDTFFAANYKATLYSSIINPGTRFVNAIVFAAVATLGGIYAIAGGITVGGLSAFLSYANQYTKPFNEVTAVLTQVQSAIAGAERLFEVMDWQPEPADAPNAGAPTASEGRVEASEVYFSYTPQRPLIQNVSFTAQPGQRFALVGPTGCGKTTIINLLMRFYEIDKGAIRVDGTSISHLQRGALRGLYGMVLQDTWLKKATVRENIAYGRPGASHEEVEAAAKEALAHSFIRRLPQGYDTVLDTGGEGLSAGQRQLLCIARIMLAKPDMLILDEATSSIDTRTEMLIQRALERLMRGHTSFIVAHRLSTIQNADTILVMDAGRIVEQGSHEELLAKGGFYAKLYSSQYSQ